MLLPPPLDLEHETFRNLYLWASGLMACNEKTSQLLLSDSIVVHLNFFMRWFLPPYQCHQNGDVVGRGGQALDDRYDPRAAAKDQHVLCSGYQPTPRPSMPPLVTGIPPSRSAPLGMVFLCSPTSSRGSHPWCAGRDVAALQSWYSEHQSPDQSPASSDDQVGLNWRCAAGSAQPG